MVSPGMYLYPTFILSCLILVCVPCQVVRHRGNTQGIWHPPNFGGAQSLHLHVWYYFPSSL
ncbi:hypothetical protein BDQ94DRAFT_154628 [Aspergillus welwitschiae]|uniref:Uncharacterized protein n=1 Tax=Aspergillus welwitschiae TaxID=1341132 RepID=A0A3F3PJG6_9EURO|nr:hypothetical protein BDQ94DRAFT_154628 [Aspergillus welwitschiae]RDH27079.1 hypothetical protein BDQ94DRAFT_154628 [Aspergillus welwitschiae]